MPRQASRGGVRAPEEAAPVNAESELKRNFFTAVALNEIERVRDLIDDVNVNMRDDTDNKNTPLMVASTMGNTEIAKILIEAGAFLDIKNINRNTALILATISNRIEIAKMLIEAGSNINNANYNGDTPLILATLGGNMQLVKMLIEAGADINKTNESKTSALMLAVFNNVIDIVKYLISAGADINLKSNNGNSALLLATSRGHIEITKILVDAGADINIIHNNKNTALIIASITNNIDIIRILLAANADVNIKNISGQTALLIAANNGSTDIVKLLLEKNPILIDEIRIGIKRKTFAPEIIELLAEHYKDIIKSTPWKGQTRGNIEKFDTLFTNEESMRNWSFCPICLGWIPRGDGCMYMKHDCTKMPYYHEELYEKYRNREGNITWCTICGRICIGHAHYPIVSADAAKPEALFMPHPNPFETDCRISNGGGGLPEKIARIRQLRETALELQSEVDKIEHEEAMNTLVEDAWNAAKLTGTRKLKRIEATKAWNIPATNFPANSVANTAAANVITNANDPSKYSAPTILSPGVGAAAEGRNAGYEYNSVSYADDIPLIVFKHKDKDGNERIHQQIGKDSLLTYIMTSENRGKCFDADCGGLLYPREIELAFADPKLAPTITGGDRAKVAKYKEWFNKWRAEDAKRVGGRRRVTRRHRAAKRDTRRRRSATKSRHIRRT